MDSTGCDKCRTNAEVDRIIFHLQYIVLPSFLVTLILASERNVLPRWTHSLFFFAFLVYLVYSFWTHESQHRTGYVWINYSMGSALGSCIFNTLHFLVLVDPLKEYRHGGDDPRVGPNELQWTKRTYWVWRAVISLRNVGWNCQFFGGYAGIRFYYYTVAFVCVGSGYSEAGDWPKPFGSLKEAYSVRNLWGRTWHQFIRRFCISPGTKLAKALGVMPKSLTAVFIKLYTTFFVSALMHSLGDYMVGREYVGVSFGFFFLQPFAIMFEEVVKIIIRGLGLDASSTCQLSEHQDSKDQDSDGEGLWSLRTGFMKAIGPSKSITIMVQLCPVIIISLAIRTAFVLAAPVHDGSVSSVAAPQAQVRQCQYNPSQAPKAGNRRATSTPYLPEHMILDIENSSGYAACKAEVDHIIRDWKANPSDEELRNEIAFWWDRLVNEGKTFQNQVNEMKANSAHPGETAACRGSNTFLSNILGIDPNEADVEV
ncbi:membrane bound O-acyl transferase family-domain-containing protein [Lentinula detonsa]|uniref:Membrane bound O-acyl transferase family-domain-containing protein n=1 Tax=Lentinula detonsa TaxID=2804962 RepID=A0A9W8TW08_9AGAR|nr:membrane bound O-acyl transferase family-domain-containing protein [Lentinula detonsa]